MFRAQIVSYFTHIYYNIKLFFDVLSRKTYPQDEIPQDEIPQDEILVDFDEFVDIESDTISLLRSRRV